MKIKIRTILFWVLSGILLILSAIIFASSEWFGMRFKVGMEEVLFTITSPLSGADTDFMNEAVAYVIPFVIKSFLILMLLIAISSLFYFVFNIKVHVSIGKSRRTIKFYKLYHFTCLITIIAALFSSICYGFDKLQLTEYISRKLDKTTIYEEYYTNPNDVSITANENARNVIYIYLESMETTYLSTQMGGYQETNYIPKLTTLAQENVSFSHTDFIGGANITSGAGWTMGALFSSTTGVPFSLPVEGNSMNTFENFTPGITALGDILNNHGYNQVFLCGSDGTFGGRQNYFEQHGNYNVIDYYDMIEKGYINEDYFVWWGVEDRKLYDIAKTELTELAKSNTPFNFTMLTVDTHHVDGYICDVCKNTHETQLANVLQCADTQVYEFVNWCKNQDFYENTVIIITGDHFRMDSSLVSVAANEGGRRLYNCYINSAKEPTRSFKNRNFTSLDFFPTTLSAMGFEIEGDRLGLGTDLFSTKNTLPEDLGFETFNTELQKYSVYYTENFE